MLSIPTLSQTLTPDYFSFLQSFTKSCRHTTISMLKNSQSGHPGGSLSCIDYLSLIYTSLISQNGEKVVVSNGHISPAVYSVLAELGYISKEDVIENFRKIGSVFEGHITRHVDGILYGTGPLGVGASVAEGFALAEKLKEGDQKIYALIGDGEADEGQIYEMINSSAKYKLDNLILFVDYNKVQLTASLDEVMPLDLKSIFEAGKWQVIEADGHDYLDMWKALGEAHQVQGKPVVILGHTIMGKGVDFMEEDGQKHQSSWHGKAPSPEQCDEVLAKLQLSSEEKDLLENFRKNVIKWKPAKPNFIKNLSKDEKVDIGEQILYEAGTITDCRGAYGKALLDLAQKNSNVVALCADLRGSVKTDGLANEFPDRHIEVGIAEQNMISIAGGLSLSEIIPFASTFGVFMTSRAKDQVRCNDINQTNVKMVATHCGLSVGEDGPTHQVLDDMGSFLGLFNTMVIEPADANQTDRIIRYVASHYGNFYVRMGRHKFPVILKEDGSVFYDQDYEYKYGRTDTIRKGSDITVIASGACVHEAIQAREKMSDLSIEIIAASSIKKFDDNLIKSIQKIGKVITVEDHNTYSGLGGQVGRLIAKEGLKVEKFVMLGVEEYQLSGTSSELYQAVGIDSEGIVKACKTI